MTPLQLLNATQGRDIPGYTKLLDKETAEYGLALYHDDLNNLYVGLSGTRPTVRDWLRNAQFTTDAGYHYGAEKEAWDMLSILRPYIAQYTPSIIHIGGHSQGGAVAVILAEILKQERPSVAAVVCTFGALPAHALDQPVGDISVRNYVNRADPMAWVPWSMLGLKYAGKVIKLGPSVLCPDPEAHTPSSYRKALS